MSENHLQLHQTRRTPENGDEMLLHVDTTEPPTEVGPPLPVTEHEE